MGEGEQQPEQHDTVTDEELAQFDRLLSDIHDYRQQTRIMIEETYNPHHLSD